MLVMRGSQVIKIDSEKEIELPDYIISYGLDVHGFNTLTIWACGCPLRCPFCHNWKIAEMKVDCMMISGDMLGVLVEYILHFSGAKYTTDFVHITGGEPLLYPNDILQLALNISIPLSVNSSFAFPIREFEKILSSENIRHFAYDIKIPFRELSGLPEERAKESFKHFIQNLKTLYSVKDETEVRVPVSTLTTPKKIAEVLRKIDGNYSKSTLRVFPLVSSPLTPRDPNWKYYKAKISDEEEAEWRRLGREFNFRRVVVRKKI